MSNKLIPTLETGQGYTYLKFSGILDEDNLLVNLISQIQGQFLLIDLAGLERINSCGVRDWVNWLNQIQALGIKVILLRCSPSVVAQANMVTNFAKDAYVHSFYAPYVDPDSGEEYSKFILTEDILKTRPIQAPKFYLDNGTELEFDEFEESYFAFLQDPAQQQYQMPDNIADVVRKSVPELGQSGSSSVGGRDSFDAPPMPQMHAAPASVAPVSGQVRHEQPPLPNASYRPAPMQEVPRPRSSQSHEALRPNPINTSVSGTHNAIHKSRELPAVSPNGSSMPQDIQSSRWIMVVGCALIAIILVVLVVIIVQKLT